VFWNIKEAGIRIYPGLNSLTTIVTKRVWRWHHSNYYIDVDDVPHSIGLNQERRLSLEPTLSKKLKRLFIIFKIPWKPQNHVKDLCKQEASTFGIWNWKLGVFETLTYERREEVWGKRKVSASLHRTVFHPQEVWNCGLQAGLITILSRSTRHLLHVTFEEMLKSYRGCRVAWSDITRGWLVVPRAPNQDLGLEGSCHMV
jgi:hypothetical protein